MKSLALQLYMFATIMFGGFIGLAGAMTPSVMIWGPSILSTAMGHHPDKSHPAFLLGLVLMVPCIAFGMVAGLFLLFLPVAFKYPSQLDAARCINQRSSIALIRRYMANMAAFLSVLSYA